MKDRIKKFLKENETRLLYYTAGAMMGGLYVAIKAADAFQVDTADILEREDGTKMILVVQRTGAVTRLILDKDKE
jgi:hypothetical protein